MGSLPDCADISKESDLAKLFQPVHIEDIFAKYLSPSKNQRQSKHLLWESLKIENFPLQPSQTMGLSYTVNCAVQALAVNISNIWKGNIFNRSLDRLLLVYFRTFLAPKREAANMELVHRKARETEERKRAKATNISRDSQWQQFRRRRKARS